MAEESATATHDSTSLEESDGLHPQPADVAGVDGAEEEGKYVYCIIETDQEEKFGDIGIGEDTNEVYTVHHGDLAAVVSDTPIRIYDPTRANLLTHELVNETVMKEYTVIPMSFGTIFRTEQDIVELLRSTERAFVDVMKKIRGKIELGLKVLWNRERVVEQLGEESEEIARLREQIESDTQQSTYFARVQLGRLIENALEERAASYVSDIYESLKPVAVASRSNKPIGERMIMNAAFLVERAEEQAFDQAVRALSRRYESVLAFKYTGPWPPYNFVNIKLKLERADS